MAVEQIGNAGDDGITLGATTSDKVSFFGVTPVAQQTTFAAVATTAAVTTAGHYGFTAASQPAAMVTAINQIRTALRNVGLVA